MYYSDSDASYGGNEHPYGPYFESNIVDFGDDQNRDHTHFRRDGRQSTWADPPKMSDENPAVVWNDSSNNTRFVMKFRRFFFFTWLDNFLFNY
jgi:hypothetical protein